MRYGSVCSGVEAASLAWEGLGWQPAWFSEIEPFPSAVLAHRWPHVPNLGDMTTLFARIASGEVEAPDMLVGGTPCQAFSFAGQRQSLADARGNLTLELAIILEAIDAQRQSSGKPPAILVWENVPGVLSVRDNAFGCLLGALAGEDCPLVPPGQRWTDAGCVHGPARAIAWRVLDAQYFGVAQRRRRVILVASAGDVNPAAILFERHSLSGDSQPRTAAGEGVAGATACGAGAGGNTVCRMRGFGDYVTDTVGGTLKTRDCRDTADLVVVHGRQDPCVSDKAYALDRQGSGNTNVICLASNTIGRQPQNGGNGTGFCANTAYTLTAADRHAVQVGASVRRLTPLECERLQGMPDNHTRIPWRGKTAEDCPDAPRYKAIGNSMAVPVMRWIGERIEAAGKIKKETV